MTKLLLASRNPHKTTEFAEILGAPFEILDLTAIVAAPEVEETGSTFTENAILKAEAASRRSDMLVIADDSGLEVAALDGQPGVRSARYAGRGATDAENVAKLLRELRCAGTASGAAARFVCVLALARDGKILRTFQGEVAGTIVDPPRGAGGFGYDPVFVPVGFEATFAGLPAEVKNRISHRAQAIAGLRGFLDEMDDGQLGAL